MTLEGEVNRFLHRHPNVDALVLLGALVGILVVGGKLVDYVAEYLPIIPICLVVLILGMMALAGNRHLS